MNTGNPRGAVELLVADGLACAAAAGLASVPAVYRRIDPTLKSQRRVVAALLATSGALLGGAVTNPRRTLRPAATVNAAWVVCCGTALSRKRSSRIASAVIAATGAFDAAAGLAQWRLSRENSDVRNVHDATAQQAMPLASSKSRRQPGRLAGRVTDEFFDPLPADELDG